MAVLALFGAGAFLLLSRRDRPPRADQTTRSDEQPVRGVDTGDRTERRLAHLEARVTRLEREAMLRRRIAQGSDAGAGARPDLVDNPLFEAAVRDLLQQVDGEQEEQRRERRRRRMLSWANDSTDELADQLSLRPEQKRAMQELLRRHFERMFDARESSSSADAGQGARSRFRAAREALDAEIDSVLTPDQRRQADSLRERGEFLGFRGRPR
jgi:hypothetical protein